MNRSNARHWFRAMSLLVLMTGGFSHAQEKPDAGGNGRGEGPARLPGPRLHLSRGDTFPDVMLYTGEGQEFRTTRLQGSPSVLVFGCLT